LGGLCFSQWIPRTEYLAELTGFASTHRSAKVGKYVAMDEKHPDFLRLRYRSAFQECRGLLGKGADELSDDEVDALEALEAARRDLLAALWAKSRDVH
jgi:hypothetical protein